MRAVFATRDYSEGKYLMLATREGMVKKTELRKLRHRPARGGLIAIKLEDGDELVGVQLTDGDEDLLVVSARGQAARFHEGKVRAMGRDTRGVRAMTLDKGDRVLALCVARDDEDLLVVTGNGYGKRTPMADYPRKGRPTKGVRTLKVTDRKGELITARPVREGQELLLISQMGQVIRIQVDSIRRTGRSTEGVRVMNMAEDDLVCGVASVVEADAVLDGDEDEDGVGRRRPGALRGDGAAAAAGVASAGGRRPPRSRRAPPSDGARTGSRGAGARAGPGAGLAGGGRAAPGGEAGRGAAHPPHAGRPPFLVDPDRAAGAQLVRGLADPRPREPHRRPLHGLPRAGAGRERVRGHLPRRHHPGHLQEGGDLPRRLGHEGHRLRDRAAGLRGRRAPGQLLIDQDVVVNAKPVDEGRPLLQTLLLSFGPVILLVLLFVFLARRAGGAGSAISGLGRSKAKRYDASGTRVTFEDVAGIDEAEDELVEIVDFLKNPDRYLRLGGRIPRGVLLSGPPGTGKTLLARAVAGEADVPFFSLSASEFVEIIVGVGASRVRDLFTQAKATAPAIIFIDELDAIGRARGGSASLGGNDEREQTLNQILTEMDGFSGTEGVIVLAATNRPEILDPALLRPGRFDRRVTVSPPDRDGRAAILRVHTARRAARRRRRPGPDRRSRPPAWSGADLANLVNEAALTAARRDHDARPAERLHRGARADRAGGGAPHHDLAGRARAHGLPRERPRAARHAAAGGGPGAQGLDRAAWAGPGRDLPGARRRPLRLRRWSTCAAGSSAPWAAAPPRRSSTATSPPGPSPTSSRSRTSPAGWSGGGGCREAIGPISVLPGPNDEPLLPRSARPDLARTRCSSWTRRCAGSWTSATSRRCSS